MARWKRRMLGFFFLLLLLVWVADLIRFSSLLFLMPAEKYGEKYMGAPVDVIAVLTGGQRRLKEAFAFLQKEQGRTLFISGIDEGVRLEDILSANKIDAKAEDYLGRIFVDRVSKSTLDNAIEIRKIAMNVVPRALTLRWRYGILLPAIKLHGLESLLQ